MAFAETYLARIKRQSGPAAELTHRLVTKALEALEYKAFGDNRIERQVRVFSKEMADSVDLTNLVEKLGFTPLHRAGNCMKTVEGPFVWLEYKYINNYTGVHHLLNLTIDIEGPAEEDDDE